MKILFLCSIWFVAKLVTATTPDQDEINDVWKCKVKVPKNENGKLLNGICVTPNSIPVYATFAGTSSWCPPHSDYFCKVAEIPCDLTPGLSGANGYFNGQCLLKTDPRCLVGGFLGNDDESCQLLGSQAGCCSNVKQDLETFPVDLIDTSGSESDLRLKLSPVKPLPLPHPQSFNHIEGSDLEAKILLNEPDFWLGSP